MNRANIIRPSPKELPRHIIELVKEYYNSDISAKEFAKIHNMKVSTFDHYRNLYRRQIGDTSAKSVKKTRPKRKCNLDCFHCIYPDCIRSTASLKLSKWEKNALKIGLDRGEPAPLIDDEYTEGR